MNQINRNKQLDISCSHIYYRNNESDQQKMQKRRNENFWKIRMQRQISNWRKEISIFAETRMGSDNGNLNSNERKIFRRYTDKCQESNTAHRDTEAESAIKRPKSQKIWKERNPVYQE